MSKQSIKLKTNNKPYALLLLILFGFNALGLDTDKQAELVLEADNFKNLPEVKAGVTQVKFWDNVFIQQGTLKINSEVAVVFNGKQGMSKIVLTGRPVKLEKFIDAEYGKINIKADTIDFMIKDDLLLNCSGDKVPHIKKAKFTINPANKL